MRALWIGLVLLGCGGGREEAGHGHGHGEEGSEEGRLPSRVTIDPSAIETVGIEIGTARAGASVPEGTIPAELVIDPARRTEVASLAFGRVLALDVTVGARVEAGARLATIASTEAADLLAASSQARARVAAAEAAADRLRTLHGTGVAAERSLIEAETELAQARAELSGLGRRRGVVGSGARGTIELVAPIAGVVIEVRTAPGATLDAGATALVIADASRVWAIGHAPERLVASVREGAPVRLRLFAHGPQRWEGALAYVSPVVDPATHTLEVRLELANDDGRLRPGLLGAIEIAALDRGDRVSVPRDALATIAGAEVVFVPGPEPGAFSIVPVAVERHDADEAVIAHGLQPGTAIVVRGAFVLASQALRGALAEDHSH